VASLGGESNNIEESTITSLFASGYETKPALSVPIHVVELTNVPPELRMSATVPQQQTIHKNIPSEDQKKSEWVRGFFCYLERSDPGFPPEKKKNWGGTKSKGLKNIFLSGNNSPDEFYVP
jgi:hypothetical protein